MSLTDKAVAAIVAVAITFADKAFQAFQALDSMARTLCLALGEHVAATAHLTDSKARTAAWQAEVDDLFRRMAAAGWVPGTTRYQTAKSYLATLNGIRVSQKPEVLAALQAWGRGDYSTSLETVSAIRKGSNGNAAKDAKVPSLDVVRETVAKMSDTDRAILTAGNMNAAAVLEWLKSKANNAELAIIAEVTANLLDKVRKAA